MENRKNKSKANKSGAKKAMIPLRRIKRRRRRNYLYPTKEEVLPTSTEVKMVFYETGKEEGLTVIAVEGTTSKETAPSCIVEDTLKAAGKKTEQALVTVGKILAAVEDFDLNEWSILCDTKSTISIMSNEELVFNIRPVAGSEVTGYSGGGREIKYEASTKRFGTVKYDPEGMYNLLKFSTIVDLHTVYWNQASKGSNERHNFLVVCNDGAKYRFNAVSNGMFVCQVVKKLSFKERVQSKYP